MTANVGDLTIGVDRHQLNEDLPVLLNGPGEELPPLKEGLNGKNPWFHWLGLLRGFK